MSKQPRPKKYVLIAMFGIALTAILYSSAFADTWLETYAAKSIPDKFEGEITRTISPPEGLIGSTFTMTYLFSLEEIFNRDKGPNINAYNYVDWEAQIEEKIPNGFSPVGPLPTGWEFNQTSRILKGKIEIFCGKPKSGAEIKCNDYAKQSNVSETIVIKLMGNEPGTFNFSEGKFAYSLEADHAGKTAKHDRTFTGNPGSLNTQPVVVKGLTLKLPSSTTIYMNDTKSIEAELSSHIPSNVNLDWVVEHSNIVTLQSGSATSTGLKAVGVGETIVRATYKYPNGFVAKSNDLKVTVKLPNLTLTPDPKELWVYPKDGSVVRQTATLTLNQLKDDQSSVDNKLGVSWTSNSNALRLTPNGTSVTVEAQHGSDGNVQVVGALTGYSGQSKTALINVKEYPQKVSTPNVVLYMSQSPYAYPVKFFPTTANVTGYGLTVLEGTDVIKIENNTLTLVKPGLAKIGLVTEDVSRSFPNGDGPTPIAQEFYVQVKPGTDPNPGTEEMSGDFY